MQVRLALAGCALFLSNCFTSATATAADYGFVDTSGPFANFTGTPTINDHGAIAFHARLDSDANGVFKIHSGMTFTVASTDGPYSAFPNGNVSFGGGSPAINNVGTVAFNARRDDNIPGIFRGPDPTTDTVADQNGPYNQFFLSQPTINDAGTVAFTAGLDSGGNGIFKVPGGTVVTDSPPFRGVQGPPQINNAGTVAFIGTLSDFTQGVFNGPDPATSTIATEAGAFNSFFGVAQNNHGHVAFRAFLDNNAGSGIFTGPDPVADAVATTAGPFSAFGDAFGNFTGPDINDEGVIAFLAFLDAGGVGIFTGPDPVADKVIATGDPLFGSTVSGVAFLNGLNNNGDIAFRYTLANGAQGLAVAQVPEPSAAMMISATAATLAALRRRRRV